MGNAFLKSFKGAHDDTPPPAPPSQPGIPSRPQFRPPPSSGLTNLTVHRSNFKSDHLVPEGLSEDVTVSEKAQAKWYTKILGWKESPPTTLEEASSSVAHVLSVAFTGFLEYCKQITSQISDSSSLPEGVKFQLCTLPVAGKLVGDGDGMIVHVSIKGPRESALVPLDVQNAAIERRQARAVRDFDRADALRKFIEQAKYRFVKGDILAREYRIRLRGIDAPEMNQEYGQEAKSTLMELIQGKPLKIDVYGSDQYDRLVGDVYCDGVLVQEKLLKEGCAWHYEAYDKRPEFSQWQREARSAGRGLWAKPNPVAPWHFKRNDINKKKGRKPC